MKRRINRISPKTKRPPGISRGRKHPKDYQSNSALSGFTKTPAVALRTIGCCLSLADFLRFSFALGSQNILLLCVDESRSLTRLARVRAASPESVFSLWRRLPPPLLGRLVCLPAKQLASVFEGAMTAGLTELSRLDILARRYSSERLSEADACVRRRDVQAQCARGSLRSLRGFAAGDPDAERIRTNIADASRTVDVASSASLFRDALCEQITRANRRRLFVHGGKEGRLLWRWLCRHASLEIHGTRSSMATPVADVQLLSLLADLHRDGLLGPGGEPQMGGVDFVPLFGRARRRRVRALVRLVREAPIECNGCGRTTTPSCGCAECKFVLCATCEALCPPAGVWDPDKALQVVAETRLWGPGGGVTIRPQDCARAASASGPPAAREAGIALPGSLEHSAAPLDASLLEPASLSSSSPRAAFATLPPDHVCELRLMDMAHIFGDPPDARIVPVERTAEYVRALLGTGPARVGTIDSEATRSVNLALLMRLRAQSAWIEGAERDRDRAAAKMLEGATAHKSWLSQTYGSEAACVLD